MNDSKRWMVKQSYRFLVILVVMALSAGLIGAAPRQSAADALVQIELENDSQLAALAESGISVYTSLYRADGSLAIIALATPDQQKALADRGFAVQVLEAGAQLDGIYGLFGTPEALDAAGKVVKLLAVVERQAVARMTDEQAQQAATAGVALQPLSAQALTPPVVQPTALAEAETAAPALVYNPAIQQMVNSLSQTTLYNYVAQLSGVQYANVGGTLRDINTRYTLNETYINYATRFAFEHFLGLGLAVDYDYYNMTYNGVSYQKRNVVAEQRGIVDPSRIVLVTAHLDSFSYGSSMTDAPGADDNASGSAAVMAIADILSQYAFNYTIRYVLYTGEEEGLFGSWAYSADVQAAGDNVIGVLNLDMLGYNGDGNPKIELHTRPGNAGDLAIANLFIDATSSYLPQGTLTQLIPLQDGKSFSDHYPFWQRGYPAIMAIEDWNDHTPDYHSTGDTLATLNMPYYTAFSKAALATFAHMAGLLPYGVLSGTATESGTGDPVPGVTIGAWAGSTLAQGTVSGPAGTYQMLVNPSTYNLLYMAENYRTETINNVSVSAGRLMTQDVDLVPCTTIKNLTLSADVLDPILGENINFQAAVGPGAGSISYYWDFGDGSTGTGAQIMHNYSLSGVYVVRVIANNSCNYPVETTVVILAEVEPVYLPLVSR